MASFISELTRALAKAMARKVRETVEQRPLERGEALSVAAVLEILCSEAPAHDETDPRSWETLEAAAKQDLALVQRARSR